MTNTTMNNVDLGQVVVTRGINEMMAHSDRFASFVLRSMNRHARKDWGDLDPEDKQMNDTADLEQGDRLFSAYVDPKTGEKIYVITENYGGYQGYNHVTTILFPEEY